MPSRALTWSKIQLEPFNEDGANQSALKRRRGHSVLKVTQDGRLLIFGGRNSYDDMYLTDSLGIEFSTQKGGLHGNYVPLHFTCTNPAADSVSIKDANKLKLGGKAARASFHSHTAVLHKQSVFMYGGFASPSDHKLPYWDQHFVELQLTSLKWTPVKPMPQGDPRRRGHSALVHDDAMYVFGGWGPEGDWWRNDIDSFSFARNAWAPVHPAGVVSGPCVAFHSAVEHNGSMIVFGGYIDDSVLFENSLGLALSDAPPPDRPAVVSLQNNAKAEFMRKASPEEVLEGSRGEAGSRLCLSNAIFTFDFGTKRWTRRCCVGDVPVARAHHSATMHGKLMILVGGENEHGCLADVHVLDTTLWLWTTIPTKASAPLPSLSGHGAVIVQDSLVILGGGFAPSYDLCHKDDIPDSKDDGHVSYTSPVQSIVDIHEELKRHLKEHLLRPAPDASLEEGPTTRRLRARPSVRKSREIDHITCRLLTPTKSVAQSHKSSSGKARGPKVINTQEEESLVERLYTRVPEQREGWERKKEAKYMQCMLKWPKSRLPISDESVAKRLYASAVQHKNTVHDASMSKTLTNWEGVGDRSGKWVPVNWKAEQERVAASVGHVRPTRYNNAGMDDLNYRFYEERKPNSDMLTRKNRQLFDKHNPVPASKGRLSPADIVAFNNKFYGKSLSDKHEKRSKNRTKYLDAIEPQFKKRTEEEWKKTVQRIAF